MDLFQYIPSTVVHDYFGVKIRERSFILKKYITYLIPLKPTEFKCSGPAMSSSQPPRQAYISYRPSMQHPTSPSPQTMAHSQENRPHSCQTKQLQAEVTPLSTLYTVHHCIHPTPQISFNLVLYILCTPLFSAPALKSIHSTSPSL
jgi:hypothetical protein